MFQSSGGVQFGAACFLGGGVDSGELATTRRQSHTWPDTDLLENLNPVGIVSQA